MGSAPDPVEVVDQHQGAHRERLVNLGITLRRDYCRECGFHEGHADNCYDVGLTSKAMRQVWQCAVGELVACGGDQVSRFQGGLIIRWQQRIKELGE